MSRYRLTTRHDGLYFAKPVIVDTETNQIYWITDNLPDGRLVVKPYEKQSKPKEQPGPKPSA